MNNRFHRFVHSGIKLIQKIVLFLGSLFEVLFDILDVLTSDEGDSYNDNASDDEESWSEFVLTHLTNYMVAREIDRAIEDAKNGNDRGGNMHI